MWNEAIGELATYEGVSCLRTGLRERGTPVYGPYETFEAGDFVAVFDIGRLASIGRDDVCAVIDVATDLGNTIVAERPLRASEVAEGFQPVELPFHLDRPTILEFRIAVGGSHALRLGATPRVLDAASRLEIVAVPPLPATDDPIVIHDQIRTILRLLRPGRVKGHGKIRMGRACDGGYACIDDFAGIDTAFSFGISDDISWDIDAADRGLRIYQFDHTVEDPAPGDDRMTFAKKMIAATSGPDTQSLEDLVRRHDKGRLRPNIFLKMDIEGGEWPIFHETSGNSLRRIAQIVCEIHDFGNFGHSDWRALIHKGLARLMKYFAVAHIHANNFGGISVIAGVAFPQTIEVTLVNRALYELEDAGELFPTAIDQPCYSARPDLFLGDFRY